MRRKLSRKQSRSKVVVRITWMFPHFTFSVFSISTFTSFFSSSFSFSSSSSFLALKHVFHWILLPFYILSSWSSWSLFFSLKSRSTFILCLSLFSSLFTFLLFPVSFLLPFSSMQIHQHTTTLSHRRRERERAETEGPRDRKGRRHRYADK